MWISVSGLGLVLLIVLVNLALGLLVISRNSRSALNRWFLLMNLGITVWAASSSISDSTTSYIIARYTSFAAYGASFFGICAAAIFARVFYKRSLSHRYYGLVAAGLPLSILFSTPLVYNLTTFNKYKLGPLYGAYLLMMVAVLLLAVFNFVRALRHGDDEQKIQGKFILFGFFVMVALALITNAVLPALVTTIDTTKIGPLFSIVFVGSVAYAIVRHRLFDIRPVVARSLAYVLTLGVLFIGYAAVSSAFLRLILGNEGPNTSLIIVNSVSLTVAALAYQPLKKFFDKISNRLFYRDAYDTQDVLDRIGSMAVSEVELYRILRHTREILSDTLKSSSLEFVLLKDEKPYIEAHAQKNIPHSLLYLAQSINSQRRELLGLDDMDAGHPLKPLFEDGKVALSLRLKTQRQVVGYLLFGDKRSGSVYTPQDKRLLSIVANELAVAVQNALHFEEIQNFNLTLQAKVDEATRQLRKTNEKLQQLDETKDDFISMASHQLRTPLTSVKGYISMVLEGDAGSLNATQKKLLEQSFISSQRMVYLIADLLNVSRLKTGKFVIEPTPVNLAEVIAQEISQLEETAAARHLKLSYTKPKSFPTIMLDDTKTRQVIMNFIDNAIYYTPAGGHIEVSVTETPASVEFRVRDDGIGVPKHEQHHLFTKFYRAGNARKARPDGTGLGLFMAKKVVAAQGGAIIFDTQEGKGSTFGFVFSKAKLAPPSTTSVIPVKKAEKTAVTIK